MRPSWMSLWSESSRKTEILHVFVLMTEPEGVRYPFFGKLVPMNVRPNGGCAYIASVSFRAADGSVWTERCYEGDYCNV